MRDKVLHCLWRDIREQLEVLKPTSEYSIRCTRPRHIRLTHDITLARVDRHHRRLCSDFLGLLRHCNGLLLPRGPLIEDISLALSLSDTLSAVMTDHAVVATEASECPLTHLLERRGRIEICCTLLRRGADPDWPFPATRGLPTPPWPRNESASRSIMAGFSC